MPAKGGDIWRQLSKQRTAERETSRQYLIIGEMRPVGGVDIECHLQGKISAVGLDFGFQ